MATDLSNGRQTAGGLTPAPFGRVLTAIVTPMTPAGGVDLDGLGQLARALLAAGNEGFVVNGSTGESATTSRGEKADILRAVLDAVGPGVPVLAGVGTSSTEQSVGLARDAAKVGAAGLLVTTPAYNKPQQAGIVAHVERVAGSADLPVMLYDVPGRTGLALETATIIALAAHPQVIALKDAKVDLAATAWVLARTDLAVYSGADEVNLPLMAIGAAGVVSVTGHVVARELAQMCAALDARDLPTARALHLRMAPVVSALFRVSNPVLVKAALTLAGLPAGPVRLPLVEATDEQVERLRADLAAAGVSLTGALAGAGR